MRDAADLLDPTQLEIRHEIVIIPESLKVDRISSVTEPPLTTPPTETFLFLSHDNITISNKLRVDTIIPNTVPYYGHDYTELQISHNYVELSGVLQTNFIRAVNETDTLEVKNKIINILAPAKTLPVDPDSQVNITADKTSIKGKTIYIGNFDGNNEIYIIGNVHFQNTEREASFLQDFEGSLQQSGAS